MKKKSSIPTTCCAIVQCLKKDNSCHSKFYFRHFDREKKQSFLFHIVAKDGGLNNIRNSSVRVRVNIDDVNDNAPIFREIPYHKTMPLNTPSGAFVIRVQADDKDAHINGEVRYSLSSAGTDLKAMQYFRVDNVSGDIFTKQMLASDAQGSHMLQIRATDMGNPVQSSTGRCLCKMWQFSTKLQIFVLI